MSGMKQEMDDTEYVCLRREVDDSEGKDLIQSVQSKEMG